MIQIGEELADIRVEYPVHPLPPDPNRQRVQRLMRAASRPKPIGKAQEIRLVDRVEHLDHSPLDNLVLQRGDTERPLPPVGLRYVRSPRLLRLVSAAVDPSLQIPEILIQALPVVLPRHPVHPRRGFRADSPEGRPQARQVDVVQQRGEPRFLVPSRDFAHTIQPAWHG
jgi:hypothetical protein